MTDKLSCVSPMTDDASQPVGDVPSDVDTICRTIQAEIDQVEKEHRESGIEPTDDTSVCRWYYGASCGQLRNWIERISDVARQRDALQARLEALDRECNKFMREVQDLKNGNNELIAALTSDSAVEAAMQPLRHTDLGGEPLAKAMIQAAIDAAGAVKE